MSTSIQPQGPDSHRLVGHVDESDQGAATYTVGPDGVDEYDRMSQWLTVAATAVESLESMR